MKFTLAVLFLITTSSLYVRTLDIVPAVINPLNELSKLLTLAKPGYLGWLVHEKIANEEVLLGKKEYDFIIVGSGSGGGVLANRLSEIPNWNVLLLEAGEPETPLMKIPLSVSFYETSPYNWGYYAEYQENMSAGLENNRMPWPRGKALGGSTTINYMIYTRGKPDDYDRWAAGGNPGWSYKDVLPYFMKSEKARISNADYAYHSTTGYQSVEDAYQSPLVKAFVKAGEELGHKYYDYNAPLYPYAVDTIQATLKNGRRDSVASAFLWPIRKRKNLTILTKAFVTKILIDPVTQTAYGVEFEKNGVVRKINARKEVILSAGTFNSPKLLMLSGIGPEKHLNDQGIKVIKSLPVGETLQDHITFPGLAFLINKDLSLRAQQIFSINNIVDFLVKGKGSLTSLGGVEGITYIKTPSTHNSTEDIPIMELLFVGGSLDSDFGLIVPKSFGIKHSVFNSLFKSILGKPNWTMFPLLSHPKSVGKLRLRSSNPHDPPKLYGRYFTDKGNKDMKAMIGAVRYIQKIAQTTPFKELDSTLNTNPTEGCEHLKFDSDEYWECSIRSISVTMHHQIKTARMGPVDDPKAVVDNQLKVHGIKNLRVVDCSVIPVTISAHTATPGAMIGEKAADIIKEEYL